jgi:DNA-binding GntR family transcriptional regulator
MRRIKRELKVVDVVTKEIRTAILSGALRPGSRITQEELASRLGVSRVPIRQAIVVLQREGLIQTDRWRGSIVAPLDPALVKDVYEFRGIVERYVAETLAARADFRSESIREVIVAARAALAEGDPKRVLSELDLRFHTGLYDAVGNRVLSNVMRGHWMHILRVMAATLRLGDYREQVWDQHEAILNAIETHDVERAGLLSAAHTSSASVKLIANIGSLGRSDDVLTSEIDSASISEVAEQNSSFAKLGKNTLAS